MWSSYRWTLICLRSRFRRRRLWNTRCVWAARPTCSANAFNGRVRSRRYAARASLVSSFKEVNKIFGAADIEFRLRHTTSDPVEAPKGSEDLDDEGFLMLAKDFPMKNAVSLLLVRRFVGSEGAPPQRSSASARSETTPTTRRSRTSSGTCSGSITKVTYGI
jgi:hypothetical protein